MPLAAEHGTMTTVTSAVKASAASARMGALLSLGHGVDDIYQGAVPALIPVFVAARHWDYAAASGIMVAATVLSSVTQPVFGLLTDRHRMPWLVPAGMSIAGAGIALSGLSRSYALTWLAVALSGLGVAAYHPEAARLARRAAHGSHVAMSWFAMGGNAGFALGPVLVGLVLSAVGPGGTVSLVIPAVACALLTAVALHRTPPPDDPARAAAAGRSLTDDWKGFTKLTAVVVARSVVTFGLGTFLGLFTEQRLHAGTGTGEIALITFYAVGAGATILGGRLAVRHGRIQTVRASYLAAIPCLASLWLMPGPAIFAAIAATAVALYIPFSLHVTLGQDYLPDRVGTASGVTLGLAVSIGGLAAPLLGIIADRSGLTMAIGALTVMPVVSALIGLTMKEPKAARP